MKLFDYDSHAPQSAKRLSNPNINAKLKIKGSPSDQFIKAKLKFYFIDAQLGEEKSFIDSVDLSTSNTKLKLIDGVLSEKTINFIEIFKVIFVEDNWESNGNEFILNTNFNELEINLKKLRDTFEDIYVFIESTLTRSDNVESTIWSKIIIRPESYDIGPGIFLSYNVE